MGRVPRVDQAIGIIMGQNRCDADRAFDLLRAASQNRNVKLRTVAAEIVAAVSGKPPTPGRKGAGSCLTRQHLGGEHLRLGVVPLR